jgi:hypothetical protein
MKNAYLNDAKLTRLSELVECCSNESNVMPEWLIFFFLFNIYMNLSIDVLYYLTLSSAYIICIHVKKLKIPIDEL